MGEKRGIFFNRILYKIHGVFEDQYVCVTPRNYSANKTGGSYKHDIFFTFTHLINLLPHNPSIKKQLHASEPDDVDASLSIYQFPVRRTAPSSISIT